MSAAPGWLPLVMAVGLMMAGCGESATSDDTRDGGGGGGTEMGGGGGGGAAASSGGGGMGGTGGSVVPVRSIPTSPESSVTQHGVTWTFDTTYPVGQFVNGDYFVVGSPTINAIAPEESGERHGAMVNQSSSTQGFDGRPAGYSAGAAIALPYAASPGDSVVKAISRSSVSDFSYIDHFGVLTVLSEAPLEGSFRPAPWGTNKTIHNTSELNWTGLPSLSSMGVTNSPSLDTIESNYARPQYETGRGSGFQYRQSIPILAFTRGTYGHEIAYNSGNAILRLMLDDSPSAKEAAMVNVVQAGIDYYYQFNAGVSWRAEAGLGHGRKALAVFAAVMLNNTGMQSYLQSQSGRNAGHSGTKDLHTHNRWQEDGQIFYSADADNGNGKVLWGERNMFATTQQYVDNLGHGAASGSNQIADPYGEGHIDGGVAVNTSSNYAYCCSSLQYKAPALAMAKWATFKTVWGNDDFLSYTDRWVNHGVWLAPDPHSGTANRNGIHIESFDGSFASGGLGGSSFADSMWATHR